MTMAAQVQARFRLSLEQVIAMAVDCCDWQQLLLAPNANVTYQTHQLW